ncbi:MAG: ArnT family glycosyltransferase [Vicinamibacterales bacterium]
MAFRPGVTAGALTIIALLLYGLGLSRAPGPLHPDEVALARQAYSIAQTGRDLDGRLLPLFVHSEGEVWFPPVPAYAAAVAAALVPTSSVAVRWPSVLFGVLTMLLVYRIGLRLFSNATLAAVAFGATMMTPALYLWSRLAVDGVFALPFVLAAMMSVLSFLENPQPSRVLAAGLLLGVGFYSNTTAPTMMAIYVGLAILTIWVGGHRQPGIYGRIAIGFLLPLLCLVPWFVVHPESYPDTLGRWAVHAAHLRNPVDGLRAIVNWGSLTNRTTVYWELLNPAFLFFPADENSVSNTAASGPLPFPLLVLLPIGIARVVRTCSPSVATLLLVGLLVAPLAAATFGENHVIGRALLLIPFVAIVATFGIEHLLSLRRPFGPIAAVSLLILLPVQFAFFHGYQR